MASPFTPPADRHVLESKKMQSDLLLEQNMNNGDSLAASESSSPGYTARVRALNDSLRQTGAGGRMLMTAGIAALPRDEQCAVVAAVQALDAFDPGNDLHREHDFGALWVGAHRVMWKIDAYDRSGRVHSPDPSDSAVTCRVLTIMLAEEY